MSNYELVKRFYAKKIFMFFAGIFLVFVFAIYALPSLLYAIKFAIAASRLCGPTESHRRAVCELFDSYFDT